MVQKADVGENPTPEDIFWVSCLKARIANSIQILEDTAKQFITITSFSQTVYFAAISFSEIKKSLHLFPLNIRFIIVVLLVIPLICWVYTLICATFALSFKLDDTNINSPSDAEDSYKKKLRFKSTQLNNAFISLIFGYIFLILNIFFYLECYPLSKSN
jgi:hypothetical protein